MAYTDDAVKAKLSALNETQESIVTVAQWVMFHRRHAGRTAQLWLQKLRETNAAKRLNLIYLANEVAQQSKARRKQDFLIAFSPIIAEATAVAYKGASNEIQQKLRRVVEVWRQRQIFEVPIQEAVEARVDELNRSRPSGKKPLLGGSLFGSSSGSVPPELQPLSSLQLSVSKAAVSCDATVGVANTEYDKMNDPEAELPSPPVHAARLSQLLKSLASAENSVATIIKSRESLIQELENLLDSNRFALKKERSQIDQLTSRKTDTETKKRDVEDAIMRGLSAENGAANGEDLSAICSGVPGEEQLERPAVEALTPPLVESLTPLGSPKLNLPDEGQSTAVSDLNYDSLSGMQPPPTITNSSHPSIENHQPSSLSVDPRFHNSFPPPQSPPVKPAEELSNSNKKRKVSQIDDGYGEFEVGDAMSELDADVAELLRRESNKY